MLQKCEGIVVRTTNYGDTNKIVTLYTREFGKVGVMARGAKKVGSRLSSVTQPFTYGYFLVQGGNTGLGTLQQGESITPMRYIREDIIATAYASYITELLDKITEDRKSNPYVFEMLLQALQYINEGLDAQIITHIFELKALGIMGIQPNLDSCSVCGEQESTFSFSIREGGFLCERCSPQDPYRLNISTNTVKLLRIFYYFDLNRLGNINVKEQTKKELKAVITAYFDAYSGLFLKSKRFLDQLDKLM
ncbi:DNA repair protein RecO [Bacillus sp. HMF5848]|uniref:DNA repair protein RecO n=1 Tax=Bacillus sp. HMF5848 TaxID=2495421 RepID=UPI000F7B374E|nr:DNA repair protein RecO [Bacillus sp. HMF5848]RSK27882.1 DNA repair protein RecO [Bacillus sp. HMF5848]